MSKFTHTSDDHSSKVDNNIYIAVAVAGAAIAVLTVAAYYTFRKTSKFHRNRRHPTYYTPLLYHHSQTSELTEKNMSVVGIDFGNLNTVVAVARNKGIDVIVNEVSNRATPSLVSFGEKQRYLGESAKTQEIGNFRNTVACLKRLVGRTFGDPEVMSFEKRYINANLVESEDKEIAASIMYQNEKRQFTANQLAAMFLNHVKAFTSKELNAPVTDVVISCPVWFTDRQRRALSDAAEVAGLKPLKILNDTTAAALGYGITKLDLPDPATNPNIKPRIVVFVDVGESSYQVSVVSFFKGKLIVKGCSFDRNLGGRNFDEVLLKHYNEEFKTKFKIDIESDAKATYRLRAGCEKVKKILSANPVTQLSIECIMDDKDVSAIVKREEFEEWASPLIKRFESPIKQALEAAGITPSDVDYVELVGGSTRVPALKNFLANMFDSTKLSTTLNQDEAVARGCALQCAIISPVVQVRDFTIQDWNIYPIEISWDPTIVPKSTSSMIDHQMEAFPVGNVIPSTKTLKLNRILNIEELASKGGSLEFDFEVKYIGTGNSGWSLPSGDMHIGRWSIQGIKRLAPRNGEFIDGPDTEKMHAAIRVKAKLDSSFILNLEGAHQLEVVQIPVKENPKENGNAMETSESNNKATSNDSEVASEHRTLTKEMTRKHNLVVVPQTTSRSRDVIEKWRALELEMETTDRLVIDTADRKNALEAYIYETRSKLEMAWSEYITDSDRQVFMSELSNMEDWLYSDGEDATKSVYIEKLNELKKLGDPVAFRYQEWEGRPRAEKDLKEYANSILNGLSEEGRYAHITQTDLAKVDAEVRKKLEWLNESIGKLNSMERYQDITITTEKINKEKSNLSLFVNSLLSKPKPKKAENPSAPPPSAPTPPSAAEGAAPEDAMEVETKEEKKEMEVD